MAKKKKKKPTISALKQICTYALSSTAFCQRIRQIGIASKGEFKH